MAVKEKHSHYYKNVRHLSDIDAYRVLERFGVTDPAIQHAVKKLLVAGGRGAGKDQLQDVQEAIHSLERFQEMRNEDAREALQLAFKTPTEVVKDAARRGIMSETTKRDLAKRKATKRTARRGR